MGTHTLVALTSTPNNRRLNQKIARIFADDAELGAYLKAVELCGWNKEQALVVGLVDRAFRGAWEKADHAGLLYAASKNVALLHKAGRPIPPSLRYREPADVLREYHYGPNREPQINRILQTRKTRPSIYDLLLKSWERTYLGDPGAAAKEQRLIP